MFHPTLSKSGRFFFWPIIRFCEYLGMHHPVLLTKIRYYATFKKCINLKNPQDLNEKIKWAMLYSDTSQWTDLADKYKVRKYIENIGLENILVQLYGVWYNVNDVDFSKLPDTFILKSNNGNGKGTFKIVNNTNMTLLDEENLLKLLNGWLTQKRVGALSAENHYLNIKPCIVAEEVLRPGMNEKSLIDYKIWCLNGIAECIFVCSDRSSSGNSANIMVYDLDWNPHPEALIFNSDYVQGDVIEKPKNFDKMIEIAEKISCGFPELRVDLYNIDGKIYFGEMTFTSQGGGMDYFTPDFLKHLGSKISINDFPKKNNY